MMKDYLRWAVVLVGVGSLGACANRSTNTVRGPSTPENGGVVTNLDEQRASDLNPCDADRDGYDADSAECGGKDCDDTLADISPVALEKCDFIDSDCDGSKHNGLECWVYAHTSDTIYKVDPFEGTVTEVVADAPRIVDFDTSIDGTLYGVSSGTLHRLVPGSGSWDEVGDFGNTDGQPNGFAIDSSGNAFITSGNHVYQIGLEDAVLVELGALGVDGDAQAYNSSGDCVVNKSEQLFMTSKRPELNDLLVAIDTESGLNATTVCEGPAPNIFGLTSAWGFLFGFTKDGGIYELKVHGIDDCSATLLKTFPGISWYGAASSPTR